ncbi:hypothetical protein GCM10017667_39950 [Streptomyces filamentosus]|uniref:Uncharacterized protein n=1 Tax=Streptomyces filamentosus TaxID=67294 RepID=A0A919EP54_STRFL|nr:hypothetical protein GCM10017667_39950 [Streptomyces filamentosus]
MAAGEVSEDAAGLGETAVGALADGKVTEGVGDVGLADAEGAEEDDRLAGMEPAQGAQVTDLGGRQFRGGGEAELLQGDLMLELGSLQMVLEGGGLAAGDLVLADGLEEVEVAEFAAVGLDEPGVESFQHTGQSQGLE